MIRRYRHFHEIVTFAVLLMACLAELPSVFGQSKYHVEIMGLDDVYKSKRFSADSSAIDMETKRISKILRSKGYWLFELTEQKFSDDTVFLNFYPGRPFQNIFLSIGSDTSFHFSDQGKESPIKFSKNLNTLNRYVDQLLIQYENNGYPFAQIRIDSAKILSDELHLKANIDPGLFISFDSLKIVPTDVLNEKFASAFFGMKNTKPYSEKAITEIPSRLEDLTFVQLKDVRVTYQLKQAQVFIDLQKVPVSYFDGILGMVPDQLNGGVDFTGELNLSLQNLFKSAKTLEIHWEKLQPESQKLKTSYLHPLLFGSPLDFYFAYDQIKQDTAFSNRSLHLAFEYRPRPKLKMRVRYENKLGNQLNEDFVQGGDFEIDYYGLGIKYQNLDSRRNPTNGFLGNFDIGIGQKDITSLNAPPNSTQYDLTGQLRFYKKLAPKMVIHLETAGGLLLNEYLYLNDLYRLGGLQTVRGFNEGEFFASKYVLSRLEWRWLLDEKSFLLAFYDQSIIAYDIVSGSFSDSPGGIGVGMQMGIKGGNFQILYGLGKREGESFSFDSSKIHFGYRALF